MVDRPGGDQGHGELLGVGALPAGDIRQQRGAGPTTRISEKMTSRGFDRVSRSLKERVWSVAVANLKSGAAAPTGSPAGGAPVPASAWTLVTVALPVSSASRRSRQAPVLAQEVQDGHPSTTTRAGGSSL